MTNPDILVPAIIAALIATFILIDRARIIVCGFRDMCAMKREDME